MSLSDKVYGSLEEYVADGGGRGWQQATSMAPEGVIDVVKRSGLRGRGGAGFPTGIKWDSIRTVGLGDRFVVCNASEGEPGTYKDRYLMQRNPYATLEGIMIASYAVGAVAAFIVLKEVFHREIDRVARAIEEMRTSPAFAGATSIGLVVGPDAYLLGEETGLLETVETGLPFPRTSRPFMQGLYSRGTSFENPTNVNNVETLANVAYILANGPEWLRRFGTERSPGTMLMTICGDVVTEGVFELPLGLPLRTLIEDMGGGVREGRRLKAVFAGAATCIILPESIDTPLDFDDMRKISAGLGAGSYVVWDDTACMVQAAYLYSRFLWIESCGQCPSCKLGHEAITAALQRIEQGRGSGSDIETIVETTEKVADQARCALPTGESLVVQSIFFAFEDEFRAHLNGGCAFPRQLTFPKILSLDESTGRFVFDLHYEMKRPDWTYADTNQRHEIIDPTTDAIAVRTPAAVYGAPEAVG